MKLRATLLLLLLILLLGAGRLDAQEPVRATAAADSNRALIGAWIGATLHVEAEKGVTLTLPEGKDDIRGADIVSSEPEQRSTQNGRTVVTKKYTIACFDTGRVQMVLSVRYKKQGDTTTYRAETAPLAFTISGIPVDTSQAFRDIKDVLDVPLTFWEIALYVLLMLCVAALLWYLWRRYSRRPEPEPETYAEPEPEPVPAYDIAAAKLRDIEARKLWEQGRHKEYQSAVSDTVREYIEGRFAQPALEQTSTEIVIGLARAGVDPARITTLEQSLRLADMTKFAKYEPSPVEHARAMSTAWEFLEATRPRTESGGEERFDV
ncbi:MAG: hypothetical protein HY962_13885 [Ignavibacteriae bacterium]|nr:hypothetical protein [Ignavibacteriota bacterium]